MTKPERIPNSKCRMGRCRPRFSPDLIAGVSKTSLSPLRIRGGERFAHRKAPTESYPRDHGKALDTSFRISRFRPSFDIRHSDFVIICRGSARHSSHQVSKHRAPPKADYLILT